MPPELPKFLKKKLPSNPVSDIRSLIRDGRELIEDAGDDIRSIAGDIRGLTSTGSQPPAIAPESQKEPSSPLNPTSPSSPGTLTNDDIIAYQNREIGRELWQLEKHLSQGCRIPDSTGKPIPCDCCQKGSFIAGLAYESIPIAERGGHSGEVYEKIARWAEEVEPLVTPESVESGQHDYKKLSAEASMLRKELMGTLSLGSLLSPADRAQVAEKAAKLVEEEEV